MPTGAGKSVVIAAIIHAAAAKGRRVLLLAHRRRLINQLSRTVGSWGIEHDVIVPGRHQHGHGIAVGSVQTVVRRLDKLQPPDLIIIDEAHHLTRDNQWGQVVGHWPDAYLIGKTASPQRLDGRGLGEVFDDLVIGPTPQWLTDEGFLAKARIFCPPTTMDTSKLRKVRGEFDMREAAAALEQAKIHGDAVEHYMKIVAPGTALVSCVSVEFADAMAARFNAAGIPARAITGGCGEDDQERIFDDLGKGTIKVVTYCEMLSEGVDVPSINAAILLRPTASVTMYLQQVGRCLRPKADGSAAIILDHVGNVERHGLPTEERNWTLEGRDKRKRDAAPSVRMCPKCFAANATTARVCGECGHEFTTEARELEVSSGELVEITGSCIAVGGYVRFKDHVKDMESAGTFIVTAFHPESNIVALKHCLDGYSLKTHADRVELASNLSAKDIKKGDTVYVFSNPTPYLVLDVLKKGNIIVEQANIPNPTKTYDIFANQISHVLIESAERKRAEVGGARSMEDLLRLERQRGYKPGWAKHIMAARQTRRVG
jgi:superfamily II DNA or RNA helicase